MILDLLATVKDATDKVDHLAIEANRRLFNRQQVALWFTLGVITVLTLVAAITLNPLPSVFCPVVVFALVLRLEGIRHSSDVFQLASFRLAAETLRLFAAVAEKPELRTWMLTQRMLSAHAVTALARLATAFVAAEQKSDANLDRDPWLSWREEQTAYFTRASSREKQRSLRARKIFRVAFIAVAVMGFAAAIWQLADPGAASQHLYKQALAVASAIGSGGLAWITLARERKCFEQSIDYDYMQELFVHTKEEEADLLLCEAMAEHARWAVRMAGHFRKNIPDLQPS